LQIGNRLSICLKTEESQQNLCRDDLSQKFLVTYWLLAGSPVTCPSSMKKIGPYTQENLTRLHYSDQLVNAVYCEYHTEHIYTMCGQKCRDF
jgi:hypothetical protein